MMGRIDLSLLELLSALSSGVFVRDVEGHVLYFVPINQSNTIIPIMQLMQPPQSLNNPPNPLNINPPNQRHNLLLHTRITAQKPLDQLPVHKPERLISLTYQTAEGAELVERETTQGVDIRGQRGLQTHEEVLVVGVD